MPSPGVRWRSIGSSKVCVCGSCGLEGEWGYVHVDTVREWVESVRATSFHLLHITHSHPSCPFFLPQATPPSNSTPTPSTSATPPLTRHNAHPTHHAPRTVEPIVESAVRGEAQLGRVRELLGDLFVGPEAPFDGHARAQGGECVVCGGLLRAWEVP
jgi:hypothetical protein